MVNWHQVNNPFVNDILYPIFDSMQYTITSLAIWLSFEFATKQYLCIFGTCDACCFKCSTYFTAKVESSQRGVVDHRFTL